MNRRDSLLLAICLCLVSVDSRADSVHLIPDVFGVRQDLQEKGVTLSAQSTSDMLGSTTGGAVRGGAYSGLLTLGSLVDLEKAVGWEGATVNSTWIWLYGNNLSAQDIGNSMLVSGIAGPPAFSCYQLWLEQKLFQEALSVRAGLLGLDTEFGISKTAGLFLNTTFGMPYLFLNNFPNGGPTYPMAAPGVRFSLHPASWMTLRSAFSQANPFTTQANPHNFNWNVGPAGGLLSLNEAETKWNETPDSKGLSGTAKAGFWIQTGRSPGAQPSGQFAYAAPSANAYGTGFYAVLDQQITSPCKEWETKEEQTTPCIKSGADQEKTICKEGLRSFARIGFSPQEWSVTSFYADGGLVYKGLLPGRKKDKIGLAFAYAQMSPAMLSQASAAGLPGGSFESVAELSYSWVVSPAVALQPDLQYVIHPNGTEQYGNALVVGIRAVVNF